MFNSSIIFKSIDGLLLQKQANQIYEQMTNRESFKLIQNGRPLTHINSVQAPTVMVDEFDVKHKMKYSLCSFE